MALLSPATDYTPAEHGRQSDVMKFNTSTPHDYTVMSQNSSCFSQRLRRTWTSMPAVEISPCTAAAVSSLAVLLASPASSVTSTAASADMLCSVLACAACLGLALVPLWPCCDALRLEPSCTDTRRPSG